MSRTAHRLPCSAGLLALTLLCLAPGIARAEVTVASGFRLALVASGLDRPEGLGLDGAGKIAVCEVPDVPGLTLVGPSRLILLYPNGRRRTIATSGPVLWIDVEHDWRGYFVTQLGGATDQTVRGVAKVRPNGQVSIFAPSNAHHTGIALDRRTGDLYVSSVLPSPGSIDKITPEGTRTRLLGDVRPEGLAIAHGRILIASLQYRPTLSTPTAFNQIVAIDLRTGTEAVLVENLGTLVGSVAVSGRGEIFVSDFKDGNVRRLTPDGTGGYSVSVLASGLSTSSRRYPPTAPPYFGLSFNHLVFDPAGRLYVSDYAAGKIYVITGPFR